MVEIGQKIYFKREGDKRLLKGTILNVTDDGIQVRGCRTAKKLTPPVFVLQECEIDTDYVPVKLRRRKLETGNGNGLSIPAVENIRRQQLVVERLQMSETQILQARAMLEIRRRAVLGLASMNRITARSSDFDELSSEYVVAQLTSLRATAATATPSDIREFKRFLNGEAEDSRIMLTITRTSRTVAIRFLKKRSQYYQTHSSIDDVAYRLVA